MSRSWLLAARPRSLIKTSAACTKAFTARRGPRYPRNSYALGEMFLHPQKPEDAKKRPPKTIGSGPKALPNFYPDNVIAQRLSQELLDKHFPQGR